MIYRADIDGLRAVSVLAVVFFHSGVELLSGGFVGVDVFFVISGYLITGLIHEEIQEQRFTFRKFYTRRVARLLPSLIITLLITFCFGFVFYNNSALDNLGKETFFSSLGALNILHAQGVNYFVQDVGQRPLLHLWSLGVEEQFYLVWPLFLLVTASLSKRWWLISAFILLLASVGSSSVVMANDKMAAYFMPQYRAFELLMGALLAIWGRESLVVSKLSIDQRQLAAFSGLFLVIVPMFIFDKSTLFPGYNALLPCIGAAFIILFSNGTYIDGLLRSKILVITGLISYPLYLFHQPIISFVKFFGIALDPLLTAIVVLAIAIPLSWIMYRYAEIPIRRMAKQGIKESRVSTAVLVSSIFLISSIGLWAAKNNGFPWRFKYFNSFAHDIVKQQEFTFHNEFPRGFNVSDSSSKILFIGDSALQNYIVPMVRMSGFQNHEIDMVTRGGCVLLSNVDFEDVYSDISCTDLSRKLYNIEKRYELIVISQSWEGYLGQIKNQKVENTAPLYVYKRWLSFLDETIRHFIKYTDKILIIGGHPLVGETAGISPNLLTNKKDRLPSLRRLRITNLAALNNNRMVFDTHFEDRKGVFVLHPQDIWCEQKNSCHLHDQQYSYFRDNLHISSASTSYVINRLSSYRSLQNFLGGEIPADRQ
jgi:peptidoglycan/LPS O-acetylase OafA/YrhL